MSLSGLEALVGLHIRMRKPPADRLVDMQEFTERLYEASALRRRCDPAVLDHPFMGVPRLSQ
jgi:hypothetical protein